MKRYKIVTRCGQTLHVIARSWVEACANLTAVPHSVTRAGVKP